MFGWAVVDVVVLGGVVLGLFVGVSEGLFVGLFVVEGANVLGGLLGTLVNVSFPPGSRGFVTGGTILGGFEKSLPLTPEPSRVLLLLSPPGGQNIA